MKISVAQTRPIKGDVNANLEHHKKLIHLAADNKSELIVFPELSLTGYEPTLAQDLATDIDDPRLDELQKISDRYNIAIAVGMPLKNKEGISIGMIIFKPESQRQIYFKKYLHPDEDAFFIPGENLTTLTIKQTKISLAICYEISIAEHTKNTCTTGNELYIASVAKSLKGIDNALNTLSETASKYSMTVMMSNSIGLCDGEECAGKSSVWNSDGMLINQMDGQHEGIVLLDTATGDTTKHQLS
jgi:predicted amidohydrolase